MNIVDRESSFQFAKTYAPVIYQEYRSIFDLISPLNIEENRCIAYSNIPELVEEPTLYFGVREDSDYYYILYMVYHSFDWSSSKIPY
jgi:hypothetical protein